MKFILLAILAFSPIILFSQIEAKTSEGKDVILYNDGTWEYKKEVKPLVSIESEDLAADKNAKGNTEEIYFSTSTRLDRFFGNPQNKIRGKALCFIENGQPKIEFTWEVYLGDGNRYFGYLKEGTSVDLKLKQNNDINLSLTENILTDIREKYNVTIFKGTANISKEQLALLLQYPVETMSVSWKKNPEEYSLEKPDFFRNEFTSLVK